MRISFQKIAVASLLLAAAASAQSYRREIKVSREGTIEIRNHFGRVTVIAASSGKGLEGASDPVDQVVGLLEARSDKAIADTEIKAEASGSKVTIDVVSAAPNKQINLTLTLPERTRLKVETLAGSVEVSGNFESVDVTTETGTFSADVPDDSVSYEFLWTASRPRYLADFELAEVKERSGGKFTIKGRYPKDPNTKAEKAKIPEIVTADDPPADPTNDPGDPPPKSKAKKKKMVSQNARTDVELKVTTARGIVLLNVPENEVSSDLRERPLTNAAKAIVRSGDSLLMDAIRRASPKYFGAYSRTLPPAKREPFITEKTNAVDLSPGEVKTMLVSVTDSNNRAIADLTAKDFDVLENGEPREVVSVRPVTAPFNLVLVLDVSGSVDDYVNFIRKAARSFVDTMGPQDRIAIVLFNDDVHVLSRFTTDKAALSESLDSFDAGGGTAYYDALAYTLADTLRPLRGDRTAIVVLTDGDDNRSFLAFDSLLGTIQESGALIYPLYVPSGLIAASAASDPNRSIDTMRMKYMGLTTKAEGEGERLARASGGMYYPITQLAQIQTAYNDIARQLRTAYSVTFRSLPSATSVGKASRLRVKVKRENAFVKLGAGAQIGGDR